MDLKSKGRSWVGNIYHKFEAICQEVDDFVAKDTVKYVENKVQTVGESVKKICSNVVLDFHPPLGDNKQGKAEAVTKTQNNAITTNIRSVAGMKEMHKHASERESSKEKDTVDLKSCDPSEVDHLGQFSTPPSADSPQAAENDSHWKETSDAAKYNNTEMALEDNVMGEDYPAASYLSSPNDEREQHLLTENLESSVNGNLSGPSNISNDGDQRNIILAEFSPRNLVENVGLRTSRKDKTTHNNTDLSGEAETGLFLKQDAETAIYKKSEIGAEENSTVEQHPASEHASSLEGKNSWESLWTQEQHPVGYDFYALEDKNSSIRSSADEDHKVVDLVKCSQEILVPDTVLRVVPVEQEADSNADPAEEAVTNLSLQHNSRVGFVKGGMGLETNVRKEHLVVDNRSYPSYESSSDLSLHPRENHLEAEDSNSMQGISWEHKVAQTEASSSSVSTERLDLLEFSHVYSTQKPEEVCCDYTDSGGCASTLSSTSCASFSGLTSGYKAVNLIPSFLRTASSADTSRTNESTFESSGNKHQQFFEDDSVNDIADADMETIDLSDKAKLAESCVMVDNELLYAASCRPRKFRSYKKLIQEAFASRKRLIKEYEQLAIWYGDIDADTSFHSKQCLLPQVTSASTPSQARDLGESEWELL